MLRRDFFKLVTTLPFFRLLTAKKQKEHSRVIDVSTSADSHRVFIDVADSRRMYEELLANKERIVCMLGRKRNEE